MRNAITIKYYTRNHLEHRYTKDFASRTRARNARARYARVRTRSLRSRCTTLAAFGRSLSRGRRGRRVYLVHQAVVVYLSRSQGAGIHPHSCSLPATGRLLRSSFGGRLHIIRRTPTAPLPRPPSALIGIRPPVGRLNIVYRLARRVSASRLRARYARPARSLRSLASRSQGAGIHPHSCSLPATGRLHRSTCWGRPGYVRLSLPSAWATPAGFTPSPSIRSNRYSPA